MNCFRPGCYRGKSDTGFNKTGHRLKAYGIPAPAILPEAAPALSVFEGLELAGVTPGMISQFCKVEPSEIAAWRKGAVSVPWGRVVFLTQVLSRVIDELTRTHDQWGPSRKVWRLHMQSSLEKAQDRLDRQTDHNRDAPAGAFRQGERLFEHWLLQDALHGWAVEAANRVALGEDVTGLDM